MKLLNLVVLTVALLAVTPLNWAAGGQVLYTQATDSLYLRAELSDATMFDEHVMEQRALQFAAEHPGVFAVLHLALRERDWRDLYGARHSECGYDCWRAFVHLPNLVEIIATGDNVVARWRQSSGAKGKRVLRGQDVTVGRIGSVSYELLGVSCWRIRATNEPQTWTFFRVASPLPKPAVEELFQTAKRLVPDAKFMQVSDLPWFPWSSGPSWFPLSVDLESLPSEEQYHRAWRGFCRDEGPGSILPVRAICSER
jgi:hypothetical protein